MANVTRRHHYLPEFYLAAFSDTGTKDGSLTVFDNLERRTWPTKPEKAAHQRDFYRVDLPDMEPDSLEKDFAKFESEAADVLRQIHLKKQIPDDNDGFDILLNFVSFTMVRVPAFREARRQNMEQIYDMQMRMALQSRETWKETVRLANTKTDGPDISSEGTYEQMSKFVDEKRYTIDTDQNGHLKTLLEWHDRILPLLAQRAWSLVVADPSVGYFVTSDHPVLLNWIGKAHEFLSPGLGLLNTEVWMPLTKEVCLVGRFDLAPSVIRADLPCIAAANREVLMQADRRVFSAGDDFVWMKPDQSIVEAGHWFEWLKTYTQPPV